MPFVVAEPCIKCKFTDCADSCPVDCFYEGENMLAIHPGECIDCAACVAACPVEAIFADEDLPERWAEYRELNARLALRWPRIKAKKPPLPDAEAWRGVEHKREHLSEQPAP
jgi:ferredoxin